MKRFLVGLVILLGNSVAAMAQSEAPPLFVTGAFFSGIERLSHQKTTEPLSFEVDLSGTTTGGSVAVGTFLSPRWSLQLEFAFPSALDTSFTPPLPPGTPAPPFTQHVQLESRRKTGAILVGYRTPRRRRVSAEYLGGIAFVQERQRTVTEITAVVPIPFPLPRRTDAELVNYRGAATAGFDVDVAIASGLSVVPQIRALVFVGALSVAPGVGLRWSF